jgi:Ras-related protein Rab-18
VRLLAVATNPVYDVSSRPTFDELIKWFREIETYCAEDVVKILVGNKVDKVGGRRVRADGRSTSGK